MFIATIKTKIDIYEYKCPECGAQNEWLGTFKCSFCGFYVSPCVENIADQVMERFCYHMDDYTLINN